MGGEYDVSNVSTEKKKKKKGAWIPCQDEDSNGKECALQTTQKRQKKVDCIKEHNSYMKANTLRKNKDFQYVYRRGSSTSSKHMVLVSVPAKQLGVGFCVTKKVGNSVQRNRAKRVMREAFKTVYPKVLPAKMVFIARNGINNATYWEIREEFKKLLKRAKLLHPMEAKSAHE